jgi:hypothetical protein
MTAIIAIALACAATATGALWAAGHTILNARDASKGNR